MQGEFWCLGHLNDAQLLESTRRTVARGRELTAQLIAHLSEVEERRLHLHAACSSMFDYCVNRLGLSEDEACRRIDAARLARRFPTLYPLLADGSVSLSVVALLKPYLTAENHVELLQACRGLTQAKAREQLAARFPRADVPSTVRKLPEPVRPAIPESMALPLSEPAAVTPVSAVASNVTTPLPPRSPPRPIEPLAPERYKIQLTASRELKNKLEQCRDLMRHANPSGDFAPILERALELLLDKLMRERFGAAQRACASSKSSSGRSLDRATRRAVIAHDGLRCAWVGLDGERCNAKSWLELDHEEPLAKGGSSAAHNVRVLCQAHNRLAAELEFGRDTIQRAIARRRQRDGT
jgi:hypothetical protein